MAAVESDPFGGERRAGGRGATTASQPVFRTAAYESEAAQPLIEGDRAERVAFNDAPAPVETRSAAPVADEPQAPPPPRAVFTDEAEEPVHRNNAARCFTIFFSAILMLGGAILAILGRVERDHKTFPLCPQCSTMTTAIMVAGACIAVLGLIGVIGAATRWKTISFFFAFVMVLVSIVFFACGSLFVLYEVNLNDLDVKSLWDASTSAKDEFVCTIQDQLHCSGYDTCCSEFNCNATVETYIAQCDARCNTSNALYAEPCQQKLTSLIKSHFAPLVGVAYGLFAVFLFASVLAVRNTLRTTRAARRSASSPGDFTDEDVCC